MSFDDFLSPTIHPFGLLGFLLLDDSGCAAGAPVIPVAVAVAVLSKLGVELVALEVLVGNQVALAPGRGRARGRGVLSGVESRAALHFRPRLDSAGGSDVVPW